MQRNDGFGALMFLGSLATLMIAGTLFGWATGIANSVNADVVPVVRALFWTGTTAAGGAVLLWLLSRVLDVSTSAILSTGLVLEVAWYRWQPVLDSIATNAAYGRRAQPTNLGEYLFWSAPQANDLFGIVHQRGVPDVWYASSWFYVLVAAVIAVAAYGVWHWLQNRDGSGGW
jgi:hypothetical protein